MRRLPGGRAGLWRASLLLGPAIALLTLAACGGGSSSDGDVPSGYPYPVQTFADQGRDHLTTGQTYDGYNSDPPTSGPHAPSAASWGVSSLELPKEVPVHNMEHGGVVVWYNCQGGPQPLDDTACQQLRGRLAAIVQEFVGQKKEVLMTSYSPMEHRVALTAWRTLDAFDEFDEARVRLFITTFERKFNPEGF
ncbi:MAG: DUF3105 domain-containing protein [Chloroflexi bacterium]|nr:DUF3105 domain-containing protein [Chloroflexota bacterium]